MTTIADIRKKYPQYDDLSDEQLAEGFHKKFYSDMSRDEFNAKIGFSPKQSQPETKPVEKGWSDITIGDIGKTADNAVRGLADVLTGGLSDEFAAKANEATGLGGSYDENLKAERERDANGGTARLVGQLAGALIPGTAGAKLLGGGIKGAAALGAAEGGLYGFGSGEGGVTNRLENAATGAAIGGLTGGATQGLLNRFGSKIDEAAIPTGEEIKDKANQIYKAHESNPVSLSGQEQSDLLANANDIKDKFYKSFNGHLDVPAAMDSSISNINDAVKNGVIGSTKDLSVMRSKLGDAAFAAEGADKASLLSLQRKIDDLLESKAPNLKDARADYHRASKIAEWNKIIQKAMTNVETDVVGAKTIGREMAQQFKNAEQRINRNSGSFSKGSNEHDWIKDIARSGSPTGHVMNSLGRSIDPLSGGLGGAVNWAGTVATGGASLPASGAGLVIGKTLQGLGNKLSNKAAKKAQLYELLLRAGVKDVKQLPKSTTKLNGLLKQLRNSGPYTAAISASDLKRMNDEEN